MFLLVLSAQLIVVTPVAGGAAGRANAGLAACITARVETQHHSPEHGKSPPPTVLRSRLGARRQIALSRPRLTSAAADQQPETAANINFGAAAARSMTSSASARNRVVRVNMAAVVCCTARRVLE